MPSNLPALLILCLPVWWGSSALAEPLAQQAVPAPIPQVQLPSKPNQMPLAEEEPEVLSGAGYLARVEADSPAAVHKALERAEQLFMAGKIPSDVGPAILVVQGPEVAIFLQDNYAQYKATVDLAARLTAFDVVKIQVCQRQLKVETGAEPGAADRQPVPSLQPFVGKVPAGDLEVQRLLQEEHYSYF